MTTGATAQHQSVQVPLFLIPRLQPYQREQRVKQWIFYLLLKQG